MAVSVLVVLPPDHMADWALQRHQRVLYYILLDREKLEIQNSKYGFS